MAAEIILGVGKEAGRSGFWEENSASRWKATTMKEKSTTKASTATITLPAPGLSGAGGRGGACLENRGHRARFGG